MVKHLQKKLENIRFKETDIFKINCAYLKLLLDDFPNFSTVLVPIISTDFS